LQKLNSLIIQSIHYLTSHWREYIQSDAPVLPDLPPVEHLLVTDAQAIQEQITLERLAIVRPYLPQPYGQIVLDALVSKGVLEQFLPNAYRYTAATSSQVRNIERAMISCAETINTVGRPPVDRLAVLTTALVDKIEFGPNPIPAPIFSLVNHGLTPSEQALGQIQQRLISMLAYRDDSHIAAWRAEGYSPESISVATRLSHSAAPISVQAFLKSPLFYDEAYVRAGLQPLIEAGNVIESPNGFVLSDKGLERRENVELQTDEYFNAAFEKHLSENGFKEWSYLMNSLIDSARTTTLQFNRSSISSLLSTEK